jgi:hypothetical protein
VHLKINIADHCASTAHASADRKSESEWDTRFPTNVRKGKTIELLNERLADSLGALDRGLRVKRAHSNVKELPAMATRGFVHRNSTRRGQIARRDPASEGVN